MRIYWPCHQNSGSMCDHSQQRPAWSHPDPLARRTARCCCFRSTQALQWIHDTRTIYYYTVTNTLIQWYTNTFVHQYLIHTHIIIYRYVCRLMFFHCMSLPFPLVLRLFMYACVACWPHCFCIDCIVHWFLHTWLLAFVLVLCLPSPQVLHV